MGKTEYCKVLCTKKLNKADLALFRKRIDQLYSVNMIVDNLPGATEIPPSLSGEKDNIFYETGWPIGGHYCPNENERVKDKCPGKRKYYLHNHLSMKIEYHQPEEGYLDSITTDDGTVVATEKKGIENKKTEIAKRVRDTKFGVLQFRRETLVQLFRARNHRGRKFDFLETDGSDSKTGRATRKGLWRSQGI